MKELTAEERKKLISEAMQRAAAGKYDGVNVCSLQTFQIVTFSIIFDRERKEEIKIQ